jgi:phosphatidate cytidylyltransferase
MKTRAITAIVLLLIVSIPLYFQGITLDIFILALGMYASYELNKMYRVKKKLPVAAEIYFYLCLLGSIVMLIIGENSWLPLHALVVGIGVFSVLHRDFEDFGLSQISFYIFNFIFIYLTMSTVYASLEIGFYVFLYPIITAIVVDTGGYLGGYFFGKNKLIPEVSPKKTWEGAIASTIAGTLLGTLYLLNVLDIEGTVVILVIIATTFVVSIFSQFGDLFASSLKREFGIKDFSNLFPGHGGVLDRIDGIIFNFLVFTLIYEVALSFFL